MVTPALKRDDGEQPEEPDSGEESDAEEAKQTGLGQYVCSLVGRSKRRTLRRVGECFRIPGIHYADFIELGFEMPSADTYHSACTDCFSKKGVQALKEFIEKDAPLEEVGEKEADEGSSSSSDSSSESS